MRYSKNMSFFFHSPTSCPPNTNHDCVKHLQHPARAAEQ